MPEFFLKDTDTLITSGKELAKKTDISEGVREIEVLQAYKEQLMDALHDDLRSIDEGKGVIRGRGQINRDAIYDVKHNSFFVDCEGKLGMATWGDLIADVALGCEYNFSVDGMPRDMAKQYVLERSKTHMRRLYNRQLALQEFEEAAQEGKLTRAHHFQKAGKELLASEHEIETHAGKQFEQDIVHLLKEIQYDLPALGIEIEEANIVQDMDEKIDFIIKRVDHHRGIRVEETNVPSKTSELFGIQCTLNPQAQEKKEADIEKSKARGTVRKMDDIMLVTVPVSCAQVWHAHEQWRLRGCPPGGPARLYVADIRTAIIEKITTTVGKRVTADSDGREIEIYFKGKI